MWTYLRKFVCFCMFAIRSYGNSYLSLSFLFLCSCVTASLWAICWCLKYGRNFFYRKYTNTLSKALSIFINRASTLCPFKWVFLLIFCQDEHLINNIFISWIVIMQRKLSNIKTSSFSGLLFLKGLFCNHSNTFEKRRL